jgi:FtsZ-binding cell division protein ZapB
VRKLGYNVSMVAYKIKSFYIVALALGFATGWTQAVNSSDEQTSSGTSNSGQPSIPTSIPKIPNLEKLKNNKRTQSPSGQSISPTNKSKVLSPTSQQKTLSQNLTQKQLEYKIKVAEQTLQKLQATLKNYKDRQAALTIYDKEGWKKAAELSHLTPVEAKELKKRYTDYLNGVPKSEALEYEAWKIRSNLIEPEDISAGYETYKNEIVEKLQANIDSSNNDITAAQLELNTLKKQLLQLKSSPATKAR